MTATPVFAVATVLLCFGSALAQDPELSTAHDGRWSIHLVCPDVDDKTGPVKGYEFAFPASIAAGKLQAHYGSPASSSSLNYVGHVLKDGTVEIKANGVTGHPSYSVGRVAEGTKYSYTMRGKLAETKGEARRQEGRPCTATFSRQ